MKGTLLVISFFMLASCTSGEERDVPEDNNVEETPNNEIEETPDSIVTDKSPRVIEQVNDVEYIDSHEEASFLQEEDFVDPEKMDFTLTL